MIVKEDFLNKIRQYFGLNLYEAKIWTALLSRGVSTAGELSDIGNVPRSRAYDILESLEKKGFVTMKLGKPIKYLAVEPSEVVERVKKLVMEQAKENVNRLEELKSTETLQEIELLHKKGIEFIEPTDLSGAVQGRHNLYAHLESVIRGAENSVNIMTTSKGLLRKVDALKPVFTKLKKKNVKIRIGAPIIDKETMQIAKDVSKFAEVRSNDKGKKSRFCIVDDKDLVFMVLDDDKVHPSYDLGVWVNTPFFATALGDLFNMSWQNMKPLNKVKI